MGRAQGRDLPTVGGRRKSGTRLSAITSAPCSRKSRVVLNLANVTRLDAAGLGGILRVRKLTREVGGDVKIVIRTAAMHQLFIRTNLWPLFEVFQSEAEAFASFEKPAA